MKRQTVMPAASAGADAGQAVLDHQRACRVGAHLRGGKQEQVRRGFAARDHGGGEDRGLRSGAASPTSSSDISTRRGLEEVATQKGTPHAASSTSRTCGHDLQIAAERRPAARSR